MISVGLIGYGYWGPNLLRNFEASPFFKVVAVADASKERLAAAHKFNPVIKLFTHADELVARPDIEAISIATPVGTHYALAHACLQAGKHVLVEKPMCTSAEEALELTRLAEARSRVLMVDHTFLFTPAVQKIRNAVIQGDLGQVSYIDSMRVNLGLFQPDTSVVWDLGPHDLSIIDYIFGEEPIHIEATGYCHVNPNVPDIAYLTMHYRSKMVAHLNLSWMSPVKVRRLSLGGSKKMLVWDDLHPEEKIKLYNSGISFQAEDQRNMVMPEYRIGDIYSPRLSSQEALAGVVEHFAKVIAGERKSILDGLRGRRIVSTLERAHAKLNESLVNVDKLRNK